MITAKGLNLTKSLGKKSKLVASLLTALALAFGLNSISASADESQNLAVTVYDNLGQNASPIIPGDDRIVHQTTVANIDAQWFDGEVAGSILAEDVVVKYEGTITSDITGAISFYANADDGVKLYLDDQLIIDDWYDKAFGGNISEPVDFQAGVAKKFLLYFYENGGGAFIQFNWDLGQGSGMEVVPPEAFTPNRVFATPLTAANSQSAILAAATPKGLSARPDGSKGLRVEWNRPPVSGSTKVLRFDIYRNGFKIASVPANKLFFRDKNVNPSQTYSYQIVTVTSQGSSGKSAKTPATSPRR